MMGYRLYSRSRYGSATLASLVVLGVAGRFIGARQLRLGEVNTLAVPWVVLLPLLAASVIAATTASPMQVMERGAARSMTCLNTLHLMIGAVLAAATCWWIADPLTGPLSGVAAARNLIGFLGLALLGTAALGASLGWIPPLLVAGLTMMAGSHNGMPFSWAWPIQFDNHFPSLIAAGLLLALGLIPTTLAPRVLPPRNPAAD